jgi:hypothetical protein
MTVEGIDISTYQTTTPSLAGLGFVFARASYGTSLDARYAMHAGHVRAAGLVLGAYHYWYAADPAAQVATFLGAAAGADLLAIDLEGTDSGTATAHAQVADMIGRLHSAGRLVGLYHSASGFPQLGQDYDWIAAWGITTPPAGAEFWQYHGGPLDRDRYLDDLAHLQALAHATHGGGMATYQLVRETGIVRVVAGVTAHGVQPGDLAWSRIKTAPGPFTAHTDQKLDRIGGTMTPTHAVHMTDGPLVGLWLGTASPTITYAADAAGATYTQAQLDAAKAAEHDATVQAAVAAVQNI